MNLKTIAKLRKILYKYKCLASYYENNTEFSRDLRTCEQIEKELVNDEKKELNKI